MSISHSKLIDTTLTTEEQTGLETIEKAIKLGKEEINTSLQNKLKAFPPLRLYKLAEKSSIIKNFLITNKSLNDHWTLEMGNKKYLSSSFLTMQGTLIPQYQLHIAALLFSEALTNRKLNPKARTLLIDQASELGLYNALVYRFTSYKKNPDLIKDLEASIEKVLKDAELLSEYYWEVGNIHAGNILATIGSLGVLDIDRRKILAEQQVKYYLLAYLVKEESPSTHVFYDVVRNKEEVNTAKPSFETLQELVDNETFKRIYDDAKKLLDSARQKLISAEKKNDEKTNGNEQKNGVRLV